MSADFLFCVSALSPLKNIGSWLDVLCEAGHPLDDFIVTPHETSVSSSEPSPQHALSTEDPLMMYWKSRQAIHSASQFAEMRSVATTPITLKKKPATSERKKRQLPSIPRPQTSLQAGSSTVLAWNSILARKHCEAVQNDRRFWGNRLKMLHREVEKAQHSLDKMRSKGSGSNGTVIQSETIAAQLEQERIREAKIRQEKSEVIKAHKNAHKNAVRLAHQQAIQDKIEQGKMSKLHAENHKKIIEAIRQEEYEERCRRREKIQQEKVAAHLKRVRERAMRDEETRQTYENRCNDIKEESRNEEEQTMLAIQESSKLVQKIRRLRQLEQDALRTGQALRSLGTHLYEESM